MPCHHEPISLVSHLVLTAQSTHGPDPVQFEPEAPPVPAPPESVRLCSLLIGQGPPEQPQPRRFRGRGGGGGGALWVLPRFPSRGPDGRGEHLIGRAVQHVLQVVQGQKVIVALEKLLQELSSVGRGLKSASLGGLQGRDEQQSGTEEHWTQHGQKNRYSNVFGFAVETPYLYGSLRCPPCCAPIDSCPSLSLVLGFLYLSLVGTC